MFEPGFFILNYYLNWKLLMDLEKQFLITCLEKFHSFLIGAFLMAVFINGMTDGEVIDLTKAMRDTGNKFMLQTEYFACKIGI